MGFFFSKEEKLEEQNWISFEDSHFQVIITSEETILQVRPLYFEDEVT